MCWKLVDDNSGEIICISTIQSVIEPGTANLQVNLLKPLSNEKQENNEVTLDEFMLLADFDMLYSHMIEKDHVASVHVSIKSKTW